MVLHFASPASPIDYLQLPIHTLKVGSIGTTHALGLAKEKGARFVLASTSEVYGDPLVHPQREDYWGNVNPVGPRGVYDEAKRFAEAMTTAYRDTHAVNTGILRIFNTYGPRMRPFDGRAIPTFIQQALAGEPLTVAGDGLQTRSICYVADLVEGILAMAGIEHPGPINLGNPTELSVLQIAQDVIAATRIHVADSARRATDRRPAGASTRYRTGQGGPRLDAAGRLVAGPCPDRRMVRDKSAAAGVADSPTYLRRPASTSGPVMVGQVRIDGVTMWIAGPVQLAVPQHRVQIMVDRGPPVLRRGRSEQQHRRRAQRRRQVRDPGIAADQQGCPADHCRQLAQVESRLPRP